MDVELYYLSYYFCGAMMLLMVSGIVITAVMPGIDRWSKRFFITFFPFFCCVSPRIQLMSSPLKDPKCER